MGCLFVSGSVWGAGGGRLRLCCLWTTQVCSCGITGATFVDLRSDSQETYCTRLFCVHARSLMHAHTHTHTHVCTCVHAPV